MIPNIFSWIFGDPQAQALAAEKAFAFVIVKLKAARRAGDRAAELAAIAELRVIAVQGSTKAMRALKVVDVATSIGASAQTVPNAISGIFSGVLTSKPVLIVVGSAAVLLFIGTRK